MTDLNEQLAAFANETGRTVTEWLEMWRDGRIAQTAAALERYERAMMLAEENDDAR